MSSYLTQAELDEILLQDMIAGKTSQPLYRGVTNSFMSLARNYGGANINGQPYTYIRSTDELIRDDVIKTVAKMRCEAKKEADKQAEEKQRGLVL
jgi:hypothetical protein